MSTYRRKLSAVGVVVAIVATACDPTSPPAGSETILEPMQAQVATTGTTTQFIGGDSGQQLAQTFTVVRNGVVTGVALAVGCGSGQLEIELRSVEGDLPGTDVLTAGSFPVTSFVTGVAVFKVFRLDGATVSAGDRLTLVLRNPTGSCGLTRAGEGDLYPGGHGFFDARPNPPGWIRLSDHGEDDLAFMVMMDVS